MPANLVIGQPDLVVLRHLLNGKKGRKRVSDVGSIISLRTINALLVIIGKIDYDGWAPIHDILSVTGEKRACLDSR